MLASAQLQYLNWIEKEDPRDKETMRTIRDYYYIRMGHQMGIEMNYNTISKFVKLHGESHKQTNHRGHPHLPLTGPPIGTIHTNRPIIIT